MSKSVDIAVYGSICHFSGEWTVYFLNHGRHVNHTLSGYGEFPRERFSNIPLVDYSGACTERVLEKLGANICVAEVSNPCSILYRAMPLSDFLDWHEEHGIPVLNRR